MKIYTIHSTSKTHNYVGWKVPLPIESVETEQTKTIVSMEAPSDTPGEYNYNETDRYDGSNPANWDKYMTNTTRVTTVTFEEYDDVHIDDNPSRFYAMYNELLPMENPQTANDIISATRILDTLELVRPYVGKKIYVGKQGRCHYFMQPEAVGGGIRMNCTLSITM